MQKMNKENVPTQEKGQYPTGESFDVFFMAITSSPTLQRIWREAYGEEYPEEATPSSYVTRTDLRRIAQALNISAGQTFADFACGVGGPGLWVARETGARLIGIDFSKVAIELAIKNAQHWGLEEQTIFRIGDATTTGLPDVSLDGAMSIDAFQLFPNPALVADEIARLLRPGGRFVFTTMIWEGSFRAEQYHTVFEQAGFVVEEEELPDQAFRRKIIDGILAHRSTLIKEMGREIAEETVLAEAQEFSKMPPTKHLLIVARKK